jgi:outer membrane protein assembly factor BamB
VAGCSGGDTGCFGDSHWTTIAYDASGQRIWLEKFDGSAQGQDIVAGLKVSPDGSLVYVAGSSIVGTAFDFAVVAYDSATGQPIWKNRYAGPGGDDIAAAVAVAPDGSEIVVTGFTESGVSAGSATVTFDGTTGNRLWRALHAGEGAEAVGFSPDSATVFVAGSLYRDGYAYDTLAYGA